MTLQEVTVVAAMPYWNLSHGASAVLANRQSVSELSPWLYGLALEGNITTYVSPGPTAPVHSGLQRLRSSGMPILPTLANSGRSGRLYEPVARTLHDREQRRQHVADIVSLVRTEDFAGMDIDYQDLSAGDRAAFSDFIALLGAALHDDGRILSVAVPAKTAEAGCDAHDYEVIGQIADEVRLRAFDYHGHGSAPGPVAPIGWIRDVLGFVTACIPQERIVLGIPLYGYDWVEGHSTSVSWLEAYGLSAGHGVQARYDAASGAPRFRYTDGRGREHDVWFENAVSSQAKFAEARLHGIRGVALWLYGNEDASTWSYLHAALRAA